MSPTESSTKLLPRSPVVMSLPHYLWNLWRSHVILRLVITVVLSLCTVLGGVAAIFGPIWRSEGNESSGMPEVERLHLEVMVIPVADLKDFSGIPVSRILDENDGLLRLAQNRTYLWVPPSQKKYRLEIDMDEVKEIYPKAKLLSQQVVVVTNRGVMRTGQTCLTLPDAEYLLVEEPSADGQREIPLPELKTKSMEFNLESDESKGLLLPSHYGSEFKSGWEGYLEFGRDCDSDLNYDGTTVSYEGTVIIYQEYRRGQ